MGRDKRANKARNLIEFTNLFVGTLSHELILDKLEHLGAGSNNSIIERFPVLRDTVFVKYFDGTELISNFDGPADDYDSDYIYDEEDAIEEAEIEEAYDLEVLNDEVGMIYEFEYDYYDDFEYKYEYEKDKDGYECEFEYYVDNETVHAYERESGPPQ